MNNVHDMPALPLDLDAFAVEERLVARGAEVRGDGIAPARAAFGELLTATDAADFEDALRVIVGRVDDWMPVSFSHRPFERVEIERVLGRPNARRYLAAMTWLSGRARPGRPERPLGIPYSVPLYSIKVHPRLGLAFCDMMAGYAAHVALVLALIDGKPLPVHVGAGIARALEGTVGAMALIERLA